jgi:hypothetical protein
MKKYIIADIRIALLATASLASGRGKTLFHCCWSLLATFFLFLNFAESGLAIAMRRYNLLVSPAVPAGGASRPKAVQSVER